MLFTCPTAPGWSASFMNEAISAGYQVIIFPRLSLHGLFLTGLLQKSQSDLTEKISPIVFPGRDSDQLPGASASYRDFRQEID